MRRNTRADVLRLLTDRIPNYVNELVIRDRLPEYDQSQVTTVLQELQSADLVEVKVDQQPSVGRAATYYRLKHFQGLPIRETIRLGDIEIPRLLSDSQPSLFPETFNEGNERLADYINNIEARFARLVRQEQSKYWGNVVGIFGVLVSVLALILTGLPKIVTDPSLSFFEVFKLNLAQLLPLGLVLALLVLALRWVVR
jgi:hypothetical protein